MGCRAAEAAVADCEETRQAKGGGRDYYNTYREKYGQDSIRLSYSKVSLELPEAEKHHNNHAHTLKQAEVKGMFNRHNTETAPVGRYAHHGWAERFVSF